jgi:hypothetical protein
MQLKRAHQFGHHFNTVQVDAGQRLAMPVQRSPSLSLGYVQRQLVEEEQKRDEESESMQRKETSDRESTSAPKHAHHTPEAHVPSAPETSAIAPMQTSHQPIQFFFLSMLIGALIKPVIDMLFGGGGGGGGSGGGGATGGGGGGGGGESDY